ncbi:MAG TPA: AAA family ATPase, partial [Lachnospiraceae bacterium]|nr:AAA family ATPase [Lachnospiraceae bacterium]
MQESIKPPVEARYKEELEVLKNTDTGRRPQNWQMSPKAVRTFILGSAKPIVWQGREYRVEKKYFGNDALIERCIVTLAGNRGLMLVGEPGTAKTMLSELLAAAISGISTNTIQGTAGTTEDMIKYSWNYALLLAKGPGREALVPAPLYVGM